jgi:hypothetical protein
MGNTYSTEFLQQVPDWEGLQDAEWRSDRARELDVLGGEAKEGHMEGLNPQMEEGRDRPSRCRMALVAEAWTGPAPDPLPNSHSAQASTGPRWRGASL